MQGCQAESFERIERLIRDTAFSGVVHVARGEHTLYTRAAGSADRARGVPNTLDTQFALASGTKALPLLRGQPVKFEPGLRFAYCNSGYVLLALLVEAVSGRSYYEILHERVCVPAGLRDTAFLRLDQLPGSAAIGYLPRRGWISNEQLVPARGGGDGGAYSTAADLSRFWQALFAGQIVPQALVSEMLRPPPAASGAARSYGLGFWLAPAHGAVLIEGSDAGISFRSCSKPASGLRYSVLSNTTSGAWPIVKELDASLA